MGCIKRDLIVAALTLFLVIPAIPSIAHAQDTVPVAGAKVYFEGPGSGFVTTDANGRYEIAEGLATGSYSIIVLAPGYIDAKLENVRVTVGQETPNINFFLKRSGAISGVLNVTPWGTWHWTTGCCGPAFLDMLGEMLKHPARITATQTAGTGGGLSSYVLDVGGSIGGPLNIGGSYVVYAGLSTGTYKVTVEKDCYVPYTVSNVMVTEARETPTININLKPGGLMSGMVVTSGGMPLFRALVTAHSAKYSGSAYTDSLGNYRITRGLGDSAYNVYVQYKTYSSSRSNVVVWTEYETPMINFMLEIPTSGSIVGMLTDGKGNAIKNAVVRAGQVEARTDEGGCYSMLLGAGDYAVSASADGFYPSTSTSATVAVNQQTQVNFDLKRISGSDSGRISGQVTGEANPIPEFQVGNVPIIYTLTILVALLATRKIKSIERRARFS